MEKIIITTLAVTGFLLGSITASFADESHKNHSKVEKKTNNQKPPVVFDTPQKIGTPATCPVTGDSFTISKDTLHSVHKGKHVYFCCADCKPKFDKNPQKYLKMTVHRHSVSTENK